MIQLSHLGSVGTDHAMIFSGSIAGHGTTVLLDTGATHSFINRTFVQTAGLKPLSLLTSVNVTMAHCDQVATQERCNVRMRIQGKLSVVCCYISPLPEQIKSSWAKTGTSSTWYSTDWGTKMCTVHCKNKHFVFTQQGYAQVTTCILHSCC